jgi:sortase (surface protein transpeptidase)
VTGLGAAADPVGDPGEAALPEARPVREMGPHTARLPTGEQTTQAQGPGDAIGLEIPAIGVRSELVRLGLEPDRSMEVPDDFQLAGWFQHGPQPGEPGPVVIAGHVDSPRRGGVFLRLRRLSPGDDVVVHRADGTPVTYRVDRVEQHPKGAFPTEAVYGNTPDPQLRLITCGGAYDRRAGSHRDNVVVFASLVG